MNILKGIGTALICTAIVILLEMFSFSISVKHVFQNQIIGGAVKEKVLDSYIKENESVDKEKVENLIKDNKSNEIIDNIISDYMKYLDNENSEISDKTVDSIVEYCLAHRDEISKISGRDVPESEIKSEETRKNISKSLNDGFKSFSEGFGTTEKNFVKSYGEFTSSKFRIMIIFAIVILLGLLALIKWSTYRWLSSFGVALIISGVSVLMAYAVLKVILTQLAKNINIDFSLSPDIMLKIGIIELVSGIIFIIVKNVIEKQIIKRNNNPVLN